MGGTDCPCPLPVVFVFKVHGTTFTVSEESGPIPFVVVGPRRDLVETVSGLLCPNNTRCHRSPHVSWTLYLHLRSVLCSSPMMKHEIPQYFRNKTFQVSGTVCKVIRRERGNSMCPPFTLITVKILTLFYSVPSNSLCNF